ncbi:hypothetical protein N7523_005723 [Penicillium sp. IBT 18751x]|nr:hypothetical protein N7523_005723 [Penicillium sp. IBT 18751x]
MTDEPLSEQLQHLADWARRFERRDGHVDSLVRERPQFIHQLQKILNFVKGRGRRRRRQKDLMEQNDKNRTLRSLSAPSVPALGEDAIATIWGWAKNRNSFFTSGITTDSSSPILDSVCQHLIHNTKAAIQINTIHTRLLLYFLARFVDEKLEDVRDKWTE